MSRGLKGIQTYLYIQGLPSIARLLFMTYPGCQL